MRLPTSQNIKALPEGKTLEEYIFQAADKFTKSVGYFYLANLIFLTKQHVVDEARNIAISDPAKRNPRSIDPDHVDFPPIENFYIAMFNLRKLGMLEPIKMRDLNSFSKIYYETAPPIAIFFNSLHVKIFL